VEVRASPDAVDFVGGRGGKLFVWSTSARCCRGVTTLLEASTPDKVWEALNEVGLAE